LIDQSGHARLADFGLLTIISDPKYLSSSSSHTQGGTVRWMSPERIAPDRFGFKNSRPTKSSDCYALGMVIYETISGNLPFHKDTDLTVFMIVVEGKRPPRGAGFMGSLWGMLEQCWASKPGNRPSIEDVLRCLETVPDLYEPPSPGVGEGMYKDDDDWDSETDSGVMNRTSGTTMTERSTTSSGLSYLTDPQLGPILAGSRVVDATSERDLDRLGYEAIDLGLSISWIDLNDGGTNQVSVI